MKTIHQYISERLILTKNKPTYTLFPETREELYEIVESEIKKNGNECSLNHIDVSKITDMSEVFYYSKFNGDISKWNVSNITDMSYMFNGASFDGDISNWDVSKVKDMSYMFEDSKFNGDISKWDVSGVISMARMFKYCPLENNPPKWY